MKDILQSAKDQLRESKIDSASLDAELLMGKATSLTREQIIANPSRVISKENLLEFRKLVQRRINREPISHILGEREFYSRNFIVNKHTLDPRPDSECLIEAVLDIYKDKEKPKNIIDFGTGTGCLLLTILAEFKGSMGVAVDKSKEAIEVAKKNAKKLKLANRVDFVVSNWGKEVKGRYGLIISNPPYIRNNDIENLEPEVARYEPIDALDGGDDGLLCYNQLAPYIASFIDNGGYVVVEHGYGQSSDVRSIMEKNGFDFVAVKKDLAGIDRCLVMKSK